jgi:hypothetical protein
MVGDLVVLQQLFLAELLEEPAVVDAINTVDHSLVQFFGQVKGGDLLKKQCMYDVLM